MRLWIGLMLLLWISVAVRPAVAQQDGECLPTQFSGYGASGIVTPGDPNNVRDEPSTSGTLVGRIPAGAVFNVPNDDPVCAEGYLWRYVYAPGVEGWTVEANADTYFVERYIEPAPEVIATRQENGDLIVDYSGIIFAVPAALDHIKSVAVQPNAGLFNPDGMGARPSWLAFTLLNEEGEERGEINFYPYADTAESYAYWGSRVERLITEQPSLVEEAGGLITRLPQTPISGAAALFDGAPAYMPFGSGNGLRFITYFAQDWVVFRANETFSYLYRGISTDRNFFIAAQLPVRAPDGAVPLPNGEPRASDNAYARYIAQLEANLAVQPPEAFNPPLGVYEALFASLRITDPEAALAAIP